MENLYIFALHLGYGGIEKAVCSMANMFADRYKVEIISVYDMPNAPAYRIDERVKVRYLLDDVPNRDEWRAAIEAKAPGAIVKESLRAVKILRDKRRGVTDAIRGIGDGIIITTRHEDNMLLSKYGSPNVLKIAQLHHDHRFAKDIVEGFKKSYGNIDILAMLTPGLRDEAAEMMKGVNGHTRVVYIPNFLEHFPENTDTRREKIVLAVGRLDEVKRFDLLIREFAKLHGRAEQWTLRIAGDGKERENLEGLIKELGAEDFISLLGRLDSTEVEREMLSASIYAMTSSSEGFPFVLLEAQSCALPVVAFDVRVGPGAILRDGENGFLVPEGEHEMFRTRLKELMDDGELWKRVSDNAKETADGFSMEKVREIWYAAMGDAR